MEIAEKDQEEYVDSIARSEAYLEAHGLSSQARGLFYLGRMIHHVGTVQLKQKHEKKPILDKISYGGMSRQDVLTLYLEVQEKIRQYSNHVNLVYCERLQKQLHTYIADMEELHGLSEQEMVFFILAGYAFSVNVQKNQDNTEDTNDDEQES